MFTIIETPSFNADAELLWTEEERELFSVWISLHPNSGTVVPRSGGCRKVRWGLGSKGKRGGVRIIYFTRPSEGEIWLLLIYAKNTRDQIPAHILKAVREEIERGD